MGIGRVIGSSDMTISFAVSIMTIGKTDLLTHAQAADDSKIWNSHCAWIALMGVKLLNGNRQ